jgi:dihydropteroate synthase
MAGVSRKSFIGRALQRNGQEPTATDRQFGTLGAEVAAALQGAHIIRTHEVKASVEALKIADLVAD